MKIWHGEVDVQLAQERCKETMVDYLGVIFTEVGDDYMMARMPVDHRTKQPLGIMHGGASCFLAETIGSTAGNFCVDPKQQYCVGLDINTNHIKSIREGFVIGKARPYHLGRSTQVWDIEIRDESERLISVNRLTLAVLIRT